MIQLKLKIIHLSYFTRQLPVKSTDTLDKLVEIYVKEIIRLHGIPNNIISYRNLRFNSRFWRSLQEALGTKLKFSTAYHPQPLIWQLSLEESVCFTATWFVCQWFYLVLTHMSFYLEPPRWDTGSNETFL